MPFVRPVLLTAPLVLGLFVATSGAVVAQTIDNVVTRPAGGEAQPLKTGRATAEGAGPSSGVGVFERMGADLPPLPPEKPFTGKIDEAYGAYQRGYYLTAMEKALPRAQLGDAAAQTLVAELLANGLGVRRDTKAAAFWYGKAADKGDPAAMFKYSLILMEGRLVPRDKAKADTFMKKAADNGDSSAQFNWAQTLTADHPGREGLELALPYYEKSAEQGIADAQYAVAELYSVLPDLPAEKKRLARQWMARAARAGFDTAQLDLGVWFVNGTNGPRDFVKGFEWIQLAANRGNVVAQNKLAHLYINALGTAPNPVEAAKWYVLSRRAGLPDPSLEDFYLGIEDDQQKAGIEAADQFRKLP
ncbi:tetratricopeptide repeat protein [Oryzifoliimicrobium ureilyticus]|uniref:tetratricopeptide repeat protein n=1 Tax=Oryzifoliimicrobium ureilyticus TaxID=3113724 RepID=UPI00307655EF